MNTARKHQMFRVSWLIIVAMILPFTLTGNSMAQTPQGATYVRQVRTMEQERTGLHKPAGLAFSPHARTDHQQVEGS